MTKRARDIVRDNKEQVAYVLFYVFISIFLFNTIFGILADSKSLLVSGIFALFGVFIAVVALIRINRSHPARGGRVYFNADKLEFIIVLGTSVLIAISTSALFFSIGHLAFFHTLYPPELRAAWVAMVTAAISLGLMVWVKDKTADLPEIDVKEIEFILNNFFILSVMIMIIVVVARMGAILLDYAYAVLMAFFLILYSVKFLFESFKGLMDASCDKETFTVIKKLIGKDRDDVALKTLRVNKAGHVFEIIAIFTMMGDKPMQEAMMFVQNIKGSFRKEFLRPHECFIGVEKR